jgi:two-component system, OmpR family, sensor kinase
MVLLRTLYAKLALGLTALLIAIGILYGFISNLATERYLQQLNQQLNRNLAQNLVADRNLVEQGRLNEPALKETFKLYMDINPSIEIYLLDLKGRLLSFSADPKKIKRNAVSLAPIHAFLRMEKPYPLLGDDPRSHDRKKAFSVTPVPSSQAPQGYLYVVLRGEQFDFAEHLARQGYLPRMSGLAVAGSLLIGLLGGLIVFRLLTRRLERLSDLMGIFDDSGFEADINYMQKEAKAADEIDRLGITFYNMAEHIRDQIDQLKSQDALRRKLVAQISHDLRTPLAAIQGYMESLQMKGDKLSYKERSEFLQIALAQGRQLGRMIEELFELANLDAKERTPELLPFASAELVHDAIQKHQLRAGAKNIELNVRATPDLPFVSGDIGLTERVLDNLLDNALTYTPEGGKIELTLAVKGNMLTTIVHNNGPVIPAEDLPHIFEPFYQGQNNDPNDGKTKVRHAGLGLAIAKRIMELQSGDIGAESSARKGTSFTFSLPLASLQKTS